MNLVFRSSDAVFSGGVLAFLPCDKLVTPRLFSQLLMRLSRSVNLCLFF